MRVVLAPDKFKGTLTAAEVAAGLAAGIRGGRPDVQLTTVPVSDGGDGLLDAFVAAGFAPVPVIAADALGAPGRATYARQGDEAVVELAAVCGLAALGERREPLTATSRGVGEVLAEALDAGCRRFVLGIGGSASTDGGVGLVQALGARVLDADGTDVGPGGRGAQQAARLDLTGLHPQLAHARIEVACDVDNPLTGPGGAAAVYGPQKGATTQDVTTLDTALGRWADVVAAATGRDRRAEPGAGAAGGVGFAAVAVLGATLRPGVQLVLDRLHFADIVAGADLVVTGEGALDEQTLYGKAPAGVAAAARLAGVRTVAVAGRCDLEPDRARTAGFAAVYALTDEGGRELALTDPLPLLESVGGKIASEL